MRFCHGFPSKRSESRVRGVVCLALVHEGISRQKGDRSTQPSGLFPLPTSNLFPDAHQQGLKIIKLQPFNFPLPSVAISPLFPKQASSQVAQGQRPRQRSCFRKRPDDGTGKPSQSVDRNVPRLFGCMFVTIERQGKSSESIIPPVIKWRDVFLSQVNVGNCVGVKYRQFDFSFFCFVTEVRGCVFVSCLASAATALAYSGRATRLTVSCESLAWSYSSRATTLPVLKSRHSV